MDLDVSRATTPNWQLWYDRIASGIGYVFTRGGLIAIGAAVTWVGYAYGLSTGNNEGFLDGCRATTTDTACLNADDTGKRILKIRLSVQPGNALSASQSGTIDVLCHDLRDSVSRRMAAHYGCDEQ